MNYEIVNSKKYYYFYNNKILSTISFNIEKIYAYIYYIDPIHNLNYEKFYDIYKNSIKYITVCTCNIHKKLKN